MVGLLMICQHNSSVLYSYVVTLLFSISETIIIIDIR